ncbi:Diamine acetyltransferase 1 [Trichoplax sp. H2]|uniref:N-acetyltransferase domain-containing protein n=1 Tax=Trichoplax adhaerens TaxID=10228 RepID=B3RI51_TRIAD|nr:hypothetical protein TRIADDRAFT_51268 [Trichoplax adhaerens]EDV29210.1 hypothetical protein TRIADDRAFT_51268 [Trichoplax adhaerens]RDD39146.1 Diamine acetyltransferase 1 [Trichoplax sp. H2]|eukprot:XP_002108412.1 hypothetical protein TRIADDRAFT_51268 [Trichoplax adhaerens]
MSQSSSFNYIIRSATSDDVGDILRLIKLLAEYEKEPNAVEVTEETLLKDGYGDGERYFKCFVVEAVDSHKIIGFALYFFAYSTWQGKMLYLEDLFVEEAYRGHGIGKSILKKLSQVAKDTDCCRIHWVVLDWNQKAIDFYESIGAGILSDWRLCRLDRRGIENLRQ